ncbi:lamin tail domain-containing protein [Gracilimonas mengyeensis]|uniref:C-terminal domain of CHU protein family protein n=1 Tax=Gracilimonas mengyeensis TaxID=1302730 RepID=A0A521F9U4_9BACT|nr:lamin tail domain-containing protein [Gracilimonas mengyeensis]SMO92938.1 C-terminal domain of CHU protein family protein [Gracilimonas mengyeensis]
MRAFWVLILFAIPGMAIAQSANFEDGFSDKDISDWLGDTGDFTFTEENGNVLLQQDADGSGSSSLSIASDQVTGYWDFFIRMDFAPSASNKTEIYLMSDRPDLSGALNGYKLTGGENGSDDVFRLFRVDGGAESEEIITGITNISAGGDFLVKVTRNSSGDWSLEVGEGYAGILTPNGSGTDNTYNSASHLGFTTSYTSTRANLFAFDFKIEIPPLTISSVALFDPSTLDVTFSRAINHSTASSANFTVNPGNSSPSSVSEASASVARLSFPSTFEGGSYQLEISGIEDAANQTTLADTTVSFVVFNEPQPDDIIINEFMKDPPDGAAEYIELKNISSRYINLKDWLIGDNNSLTSISTTDQPILPDGFVVLSSDTSALSSFFGEVTYIDLSLPALNNTSDQIRLYDSEGVIADSLAYTPDWGGSNVALERRSASVSATFKENWGESPAVNFGTPGFENQVFPDETPPEIIELLIPDNQRLLLKLSERVDVMSAKNEDNYQLSQQPEPGVNPPPLPSISSVQFLSPDTLQISLSQPLQEYSGSWQLQAANLTDIFGNATQEVISFNYFDVFEAETGQVAINEFAYDPPPGFSEFIELYNHSDSSFNLQGWTLNDNTGNRRTITDSRRIIPKNSFILLAPDSTLTELYPSLPLVDMGSRFPALNNSTDAIVIRNAKSAVIDSITYFSSWGGREASLERREPSISGNYAENWGNSPAPESATPGIANEIELDPFPPSITALNVLDQQSLEVILSERIQETEALDKTNYSLTTASNFTPPPLDRITFFPPDTVLLSYSNPFPKASVGTEYELRIENQADVFGNRASALMKSFLAIDIAEADSAEVVINEFMNDPPEAYTEFIELRNTSGFNFDLQDWTLNDNTGNRQVISDSSFILRTQSFALLLPDSALLEQFPGLPAIVMGNRFPSLNNSTDAIAIRNSMGVIVDSLTYLSAWGGDEVSLERRSAAHNPNFSENWGDSPATKFATPGTENQIAPDTKAPQLLSISTTDADQIRLIFDERLLPGEAETFDNYQLTADIPPSEIPGITSIEWLPPDTVFINFRSELPRRPEGTWYQLQITNQTDIFGNVASMITDSLLIIDYTAPTAGMLFITEFMYDPPDGSTEFIELYNASDSTLNLRGLTYNDQSSTRRIISETDFGLAPKSYVVLATDSSLLEQFPDMSLLALGSRFASLNNTTDAIVLRGQQGLLLDSLTYYSDWGGNSVSLERRSIAHSPNYKANWGNSPAASLATPGSANAIEPDTKPPTVLSSQILSSNSIQLIFSERIDSVQAFLFPNYTFDPMLEMEAIEYKVDTLVINFKGSFEDGQSYQLTISNQQDIFGNTLEETVETFTFTQFSPAVEYDLIINEILYRRKRADSEEFVELYNRSGKNINLSGWTISDATASTTIPSGTQLRSNEYLVFTDHENFAQSGENRIHLPGFPSLNDDGDAITLKTTEGVRIDSLFYLDDVWGPAEQGISLERKHPDSPSNDAANWMLSNSANGHSAGIQNTAFQLDESPPEVLFARSQPNQKIFVVFSEFVQLDHAVFTLNGQTASLESYQQNNANIAVISGVDIPDQEALQLAITNISDFAGNQVNQLAMEVAQQVEPGHLIINEILFDPIANTDDNLPDQAEYIELYNPRDYAISLEGVFLHDEPDENDEVRSIFPENTQYRWIPAKGYVVMYAEEENRQFLDSKLARYFELSGEDEHFFMLINRSSLSLSSTDDAIYIADSSGTIIDSVFYDESWHNPNLYDTKGVSLERIDPDSPDNSSSNWSSSTSVRGGTPGAQNSIFQQAGATPETQGLSFTPNPFSPDEDGFEDHLFMNYSLEKPDYLLRVRIFDRYGRLVCTLADGQQAGFEGSLIWDGLTDDRKKNRVGIYIILFEAYNSAEGKNVTFKKTIVLARKF